MSLGPAGKPSPSESPAPCVSNRFREPSSSRSRSAELMYVHRGNSNWIGANPIVIVPASAPPQHLNRSSLAAAHEYESPTTTAIAPSTGFVSMPIVLGEVTVLVVPSPTWPSELPPQQCRTWAVSMAQLCLLPASIEMMPLNVGEDGGESCETWSPVPSCPWSLPPQHLRS